MTNEERDAASFFDSTGERWYVEFTFGKAKTIEDTIGLTVDDLRFGPGLWELQSDTKKMGALIWILCEPQAVKEGLDAQTLWDRLGADFLEQFYPDVLMQALINFTPGRNAKVALRKNVATVLESERILLEHSTEALSEFHEQARQVICGETPTN